MSILLLQAPNMARNVKYRQVPTDGTSWHQDQALEATIYILHTMGPTGFLLKEEGENKKFKVVIWSILHTITCTYRQIFCVQYQSRSESIQNPSYPGTILLKSSLIIFLWYKVKGKC